RPTRPTSAVSRAPGTRWSWAGRRDNGVSLYTANPDDFQGIERLVEVAGHPSTAKQPLNLTRRTIFAFAAVSEDLHPDQGVSATGIALCSILRCWVRQWMYASESAGVDLGRLDVGEGIADVSMSDRGHHLETRHVTRDAVTLAPT